MPAREPEQVTACRLRVRAPARVLKGRDRVEERGPPVGQLGLQRVDVDAVVGHRHRCDVGAQPLEDPQRPIVGRCLDDRPAALGEQHLREDREPRQRAGGQDHVRGVDPMPLGDPGAQRLVPGHRPVVQQRLALGQNCVARAVGQLLVGEQLGRRHAAGERDGRHAPESRRADGQRAATRAVSATSWATSVGVVPTRTPCASSASFLAWAVPAVPEMIAPACPIVFPGGAVKPAM